MAFATSSIASGLVVKPGAIRLSIGITITLLYLLLISLDNFLISFCRSFGRTLVNAQCLSHSNLCPFGRTICAYKTPYSLGFLIVCVSNQLSFIFYILNIK